MKNTLSHIISIIIFLSATTNWAADAPKADSPKTKLEQFSAKHGSLFLRAETELGEIGPFFSGTYYRVSAKVVEIIAPTSKTRAYGVNFELTGGKNSSTSSLDEDELPSLIKGIDYLIELDPSVTKLAGVTGFYRTKAGMEVQVVKGEETIYGIKAERGGFLIFETPSDLKSFRSLIVRAQEKIKEIKP